MTRKSLLVFLPVLLVCCGCAALNPDNTPTMNWIQSELTPPDRETTFGEKCILGAVSVLAWTADAVIVHPVLSSDDAWSDTAHVLWSGMEWEEHYVTECAALPLRAVATPVVYLPVWLTHSIFDMKQEEAVRPEELAPDPAVESSEPPLAPVSEP